MLQSKRTIIGVVIFLLNLSYGIAKAKPLEYQITIPIAFLSDKLFDYALYHPTWREFVLFQ
jgi:hypothetical protein